MKDKITTKDLIEKYFTQEEAIELKDEIEKEVEKIKWGGKRLNAGRKTKTGTVLRCVIKVSEEEKKFINYARSHHLNYNELMQG